MGGTLNNVMLIGNLGIYPGICGFDLGVILAKFPIGLSGHFMHREGPREESTNWHSIGS
ncbi:MAG: hypothetical protein KC428_01820 [Flavobacteriales bacterium]|nr:hypothetical protein [Flavobacteriales bacterium]